MIKRYATGDGAMASTFSMDGGNNCIKDIQIHLSAVGTGTLTIKTNAAKDSKYDTLMYTRDMTGVTDLFLSDLDWTIASGDSLDFAWANAGTVTWGIVLGVKL